MRRLPRFLSRPLTVAMLALCVGGCTSTVATDDRATPDGSVSPTTEPTIGDLEITEPAWRVDGSDWALALTWGGSAEAPFDHYEVWRNGEAMDEQVTQNSWTDQAVAPGTRYRYAVIGVAADGARTDPAHRSIRTAAPPVADARLEGSFVMVMHVVTSKGTDDPVDGGRVVFRFDPACDRGACSTRWTVRQRRTDMVLTRDGAVYAGLARTPLLIRNCYGDEVDERVSARFHVIAAEARRGSWRATRIEGNVAERSRWKGCMVASIHWTLEGSIRAHGGDPR